MDIRSYKYIEGFEEYLLVSRTGEVFSLKTNKILKQSKNKQGYMIISGRIGGRNGKCFCLKIHRIVAKAFLDKPSDEIIESALKTFYKKVPVNHKDGDKTNNNVDNLEWCTYQQNMKHAVEIGLCNNECYRGIKSTTSKLTQKEVDFIRENYIPRDKNFGCRGLARKFKIRHSTIERVIHHVSYK